MTGESDECRVPRNPAKMLDDSCGLPVYGISQRSAAAFEAEDLLAESGTCVDIAELRGTDVVSRNCKIQRRALHERERLARLKADVRIKAKRTIVVAGLSQTHAGYPAGCRAVEQVAHHAPPHAIILLIWIDRRGANSVNHRSLIHEVAADDFAFTLSNHAV